MAVTVTSYRRIARDANGHSIQVGADQVAHEELTNGAGAVNSSAFLDGVSLIRVATDAKVRIRIGVSAVAVGTDPLLPSGAVEYFAARSGDRISVINSA